MLQVAWASHRVAEIDERLGARVHGLEMEVPLEMIRIMRAQD
jgi:hypothetical protein